MTNYTFNTRFAEKLLSDLNSELARERIDMKSEFRNSNS
jgi:hypothetical protein